MAAVLERTKGSSDRGRVRALLLAFSLVVSAYLMALAIESPGYFWLGWVTLLPLLQAARTLSPAKAGATGSFWGACLFVASTTLAQTDIQPTFSSFLFLTLIPGAYAGFGAVLTRRVGFSPYLMALGWIGVEFALRPLGLHHGLLAGTQADGGFFIRAIGSFAGYAVVAFLVAYINASLLSVLSEVRVSLSTPRLVASSAEPHRLVVPADLICRLSRFLCISQPRAPPA